MSVRIFFDPFRLVIESAEALYPHLDAEVVFTPEAERLEPGSCGFTTFPDDGSAPEIVVSCHVPFQWAVEILAHELAHVAAGRDAEHGPAWEAAFAAIHAEYERRLVALPGGRVVAARRGETGR